MTGQVIKSARVMKKAVGYLIPFMEEEKEKAAKEAGVTIEIENENVSYMQLFYTGKDFSLSPYPSLPFSLSLSLSLYLCYFRVVLLVRLS